MRELVERIADLDACAVSDALDQLGIGGQVDGIRPLGDLSKVTGRVVTVELTSELNDQPGHHLGASAIESASPGDILVVAHQGRTDCAGWGGNLSRAALQRGVTAVIVHGAVRDVDEAAAIGFSLFATGSTPRTARGRAQERSWGNPVDVDGVTVRTGDYVVADSTGTVFIAADHVHEVVDLAETILAKEAAIAADLDGGMMPTQAMGKNYEDMLKGSN